MTHRLARTAVALAATLVLAACGSDDGSAGAEGADDPTAGEAATISIEDAWVRATAGTEDPTMTAAFMIIDNDGETDLSLIGADADVAATAELHEMAAVDGEMVMREVTAGITITADRGKVLEPGGYHVMLIGLEQELAPGDEVELTLSFSDGTEQTLTAPVKAFTEEEGHYHDEDAPSDHGHGDEEGMDQ